METTYFYTWSVQPSFLQRQTSLITPVEEGSINHRLPHLSSSHKDECLANGNEGDCVEQSPVVLAEITLANLRAAIHGFHPENTGSLKTAL